MALHLYDTYERKARPFTPLNPPHVGLYACGPTVYNYQHIGNLRTYIFEDLLRRALEYNGYDVKQVVNITDVGHLTSDGDTGEDKMEAGARRTGKTAWEIADYYAEIFKEDLRTLHVLEPHIWCRATDHIEEQIDAVRTIEEKGYAYQTADGVYFDTEKLDDYGYLARLDIEGLQAGARVELGDKRKITDFALWKFSPVDEQRQMEWQSPWGKGFPGWHIECSAMSAKYLGEYFDIHCGGEDHIPVHHTNEIAQAHACYGTRLANFWVHGAFLQLGGEKMSKSSGDFLRLQTLVDRGYDPLAYRFFCLGARYRAKLTFAWESLDAAATAFDRLRTAAHAWGEPTQEDESFITRFCEHVDDDLNMPRVLALIWELAGSDLENGVKKATVLHFDQVMGLDLATWQPQEQGDIPAEIQTLADERQQARSDKDWAKADELRDKIVAAGYEIEDTPDGPKLSRTIPAHVLKMADERQTARDAKDWAKADELRDKIAEAGYELVDGAEGTLVQPAS
ncbi:MAG: cysteinyl-tRNA synthetase [Candidatus Latescibacterota bacterium]|jgi:cysteinyl-tRNA synthetase